MTPFQLDAILHGAKVYIYRDKDGSIYPTIHDFSRFGLDALETVRVKLTKTSSVSDVLADESVRHAVDKLSQNTI